MSENINKNTSHDPGYDLDTVTNARLIRDHEYDGIFELDNDLPPWWKWLFYISIVFSLVYMARLFFFQADDLLQEKEYQAEMIKAQENQPAAAAFELVLLTDDNSLAAGKETWDKNCAACHLVNAAGIVGPNMTDDYWIHGNSLEVLYDVVEKGVLEKGMIGYKDMLSPTQRLEVISYFLSLRGSNPENPKEPQGELFEWPY